MSGEDTARIWDAASGRLLHTLRGHTQYVNTVAFSPDGSLVLSTGEDGTARLWDASSGRPLHILRSHGIISAVFSPDGRRIATASPDYVQIWDSASGRLLHTLAGAGADSAVFSSDGRWIVTADVGDFAATIWDGASGQFLHTLRHPNLSTFENEIEPPVVESAVFSPDGRQVVTASWDKTARIWDAASGRLLHILRGHTNRVESAVFSPDGRQVVTASSDGTARIWDARSGRSVRILRVSRSDSVWSAVFSPDGRRVVTATQFGKAKIWDAASGRLLRTLPGDPGDVVFSPDGTRFVTPGGIWDAASGMGDVPDDDVGAPAAACGDCGGHAALVRCQRDDGPGSAHDVVG